MTGSTKLFAKKVDVRFGATFNPYALGFYRHTGD